MEKKSITLNELTLVDILDFLQYFRYRNEQKAVGIIQAELSKKFTVNLGESYIHLSRKGDSVTFNTLGDLIDFKELSGTEVAKHLLSKWGEIS